MRAPLEIEKSENEPLNIEGLNCEDTALVAEIIQIWLRIYNKNIKVHQVRGILTHLERVGYKETKIPKARIF